MFLFANAIYVTTREQFLSFSDLPADVNTQIEKC